LEPSVSDPAYEVAYRYVYNVTYYYFISSPPVIDGTQSQDKELDMLIFYAGTFGYIGQLNFTDKGCCYDERLEMKASMNISAAIPVHEEDASSIVGKLTEGGIEVDTERLPSALIHYILQKNNV